MAEKKIIAASVQVDTDSAQKNVLKLKGTVEDLRKEFKKTEAGTDEQLAALKKLKAAEEDLAKAQDALNKSNDKQNTSFSKIKGSLNELPGAAGAAGKGVQGLSAQFKALLANPIILVIAAIVTALTLLYKAFTSTNDGADKMEQIFKGLGAVIDVIRDRVLKIAGAIAKFFSGDFKGALSDARAAVSGIGDEIASEFNKAADAAKRLQEVDDAMRDLGVSRAKLNRDLARTKEIITDENATYEEKKKAIEEVRKKEGEQTAQELANARKKLQAIKDANALSDTSDEDLQKEADAQEQVYRLEEKSASDIRSLNKQSRTIERQEEAKRKEERQRAIEEEKRRRQELVEFTNKLTKLQQDNELALIKDGYKRELKALENRIADEKRQNELAFKDKKINREQLNQLNAALDVQSNLQRAEIEDKHNKEVAAKDAAFQKDLADINNKIRIDGIKDTRKAELIQLEIGYQEKLQQAIEKYRDDSAKLVQIQSAIDEQYRVAKAEKEAKYKEEDDKKKLDQQIAAQELIVNNQKATFEAQRAALDAEQALFDEALKTKVITEEQYNEKTASLSNARKTIREAEQKHNANVLRAIGDALGTLSEIAGKQTAVGKALAIAQTTISTYQSAIGAFKGMVTTIPGPVGIALGVVAAAGALKTGIDAVKKIVATKIPGAADTGGAAPSGITAPAAPVAPTQASTSLDQNTINNIGNAAAGGVNAVRAYVVEQDSAAAAARAQRLQGAAVLGG